MTTATMSVEAQDAVAAAFARAMRRAGDALGAMSGQIIEVQTPELRRCTAADVMDMAGGPEAVVLAVYVGISGPLSGHALLLFSPDNARRLARILLAGLLGPGTLPIRPAADDLSYDELELSALCETGNITISSFLNEIALLLSEPVMPTPPQIMAEMAGAVLDAVLIDLMAEDDQVLAAKTTFSEGGRAIDGTLFVLPRADGLRALLDAMGVA
jgi:chemotaxis protein CheC